MPHKKSPESEEIEKKVWNFISSFEQAKFVPKKMFIARQTYEYLVKNDFAQHMHFDFVIVTFEMYKENLRCSEYNFAAVMGNSHKVILEYYEKLGIDIAPISISQ